MKKLSLLVIFITITVSLFAQEIENKPTETPPDNLVALQTANSLAKYGYSIQSASALIGAAEIFARVQTQPLGAQAERGQQAAPDTVTTPEFTPANLLADARRFAGNDRTMTAWANDVQRALNNPTRGAVGGPKYAIDIIADGDTHTYNINLRGNERTDLILSGNGATDLDLYVYDAFGNFIIADQGYTDDAYIWIIPPRPGNYIIKIKNWGSGRIVTSFIQTKLLRAGNSPRFFIWRRRERTSSNNRETYDKITIYIYNFIFINRILMRKSSFCGRHQRRRFLL